MKICIASDHAGYKMKEYIKKRLSEEYGYEIIDFGTYSEESVDYPDYGSKVAEAVSKGEFKYGILICGTGLGMCIVANKYPGVRAGVAYSDEAASLLKRHNNANIICLGGRTMNFEEAFKRVLIWLNENFEGGRHKRRVDKIINIEVSRCSSK